MSTVTADVSHLSVANGLVEVKRDLATQVPIVHQICDAILKDLDELCAMNAEHGWGIRHHREVAYTSRPRNEHFKATAGMYLGFGLGKDWQNIGFFEDSVVTELRARFKLLASQFESPSGSENELRTQPDLYLTAQGAYELAYTYCWFVYKRV